MTKMKTKPVIIGTVVCRDQQIAIPKTWHWDLKHWTSRKLMRLIFGLSHDRHLTHNEREGIAVKAGQIVQERGHATTDRLVGLANGDGGLLT